MRLFLILLIVPIVEIGLFIEVGGLIGTWPTIGIVILTALLGSWLLRRQGLAAMRDVQSRLQAGDSPGQLLAEGAMILFAGALLLTPGFFTDATGLLLLLPPVRAALWRWIEPRVKVQAGVGHARAWYFTAGGTVVDGDFSEVRPADEPVNRPGPPRIDRGGSED
jgi:UPF0716 protein FxsA